MQTIRLSSDKVTENHKAFRVLAEEDDGSVAIVKSYNTSANDARIFADVYVEMNSEAECGYPDKIEKTKAEVAAEAEADTQE